MEAEVKRREETGEGSILNPNLSSARPIYDESIEYEVRNGVLYRQGLRIFVRDSSFDELNAEVVN